MYTETILWCEGKSKKNLEQIIETRELMKNLVELYNITTKDKKVYESRVLKERTRILSKRKKIVSSNKKLDGLLKGLTSDIENLKNDNKSLIMNLKKLMIRKHLGGGQWK